MHDEQVTMVEHELGALSEQDLGFQFRVEVAPKTH